jgi:hypothetical protein
MDDPVRFEFDGALPVTMKTHVDWIPQTDVITRGHGAIMRHGMLEMAVSFLKQKHEKEGYVGGIEVKNDGFPVYKLSINGVGEISRDA